MIERESPKCDSSLMQIKAQKVSQVQEGKSTKKLFIYLTKMIFSQGNETDRLLI